VNNNKKLKQPTVLRLFSSTSISCLLLGRPLSFTPASGKNLTAQEIHLPESANFLQKQLIFVSYYFKIAADLKIVYENTFLKEL
jgi:hypothetical protein